MEPPTPDQAPSSATRSARGRTIGTPSTPGRGRWRSGDLLYDLFTQTEAAQSRLATEPHDRTLTRARRPWEPPDE